MDYQPISSNGLKDPRRPKTKALGYLDAMATAAATATATATATTTATATAIDQSLRLRLHSGLRQSGDRFAVVF
jgi:hypothetical protein